MSGFLIAKFLHIAGAIVMGAGLFGVWFADLRSRQVDDLPRFAEAVRTVAVMYDGVVVPGALMLLGSGSWLIVGYHGGWSFVTEPWLLGMVLLFAFEFVEGNTITRLYFMRLRRLTAEALAEGGFTPEIEQARGHGVATFTHFLDLPMLFLIVALGTLRPDNWVLFGVGVALALLVASVLSFIVPRLYPWPVVAK